MNKDAERWLWFDPKENRLIYHRIHLFHQFSCFFFCISASLKYFSV